MQVSAWPVLVLALGALPMLAGCGPPTATISGEVTVDGRPLETGVISYAPADRQGAPSTAAVRDGKYQLTTAPGKTYVQISAPVVVGKRKAHNGPGAPLLEVTAESLPPRYNAATELTFDARPGSNTKNWALKGKARKP